MEKTLIAILLSLCSIAAAAQVRYEKGWFVDNTGRKVECLIKNDERFSKTSQFMYKMSEDSEERVATIAEISSFSVGNMLFERHEVMIDYSEDDINAGYDISSEPNQEREVVFLQVLCDGQARLYYYEIPKVKKNYFFSTTESPELEYLINKNYMTDNRTGFLRENKAFRHQLYIGLANMGVTPDDVNHLEYDENQLMDLFDKLNGTKSARYAQGRFGIDLQGTYRPASHGGYSIGAGVSFEYLFSKYRNKWAVFFMPEMKMLRMAYTGKDGEIHQSNTIYDIQLQAGGRYYMYLNNSVRCYLEGSLNLGIGLEGEGGWDNINIGGGVKLSDLVSIGVMTHLSYGLLLPGIKEEAFSNGKVYDPTVMGFFDKDLPAWPVTFTVRFSIPGISKKK